MIKLLLQSFILTLIFNLARAILPLVIWRGMGEKIYCLLYSTVPTIMRVWSTEKLSFFCIKARKGPPEQTCSILWRYAYVNYTRSKITNGSRVYEYIITMGNNDRQVCDDSYSHNRVLGIETLVN